MFSFDHRAFLVFFQFMYFHLEIRYSSLDFFIFLPLSISIVPGLRFQHGSSLAREWFGFVVLYATTSQILYLQSSTIFQRSDHFPS